MVVAVKVTPAVRAAEVSENAKLGPVSATYVSQASCSGRCPFKGKGCYAQYGYTAITTKTLNRSTLTDPVRLAFAESRAIDRLSGRLPLRLHVVGDCRTKRAARIVGKAAARYFRKHRQPVWTYTHSWRTVPRVEWGGVSVLASCETAGHVLQAHERGYAAALVVAEHPADGKAHPLEGAPGFKGVPCPNQTRDGITCADCRLCFDDGRLHRSKLVITFAAHSQGQRAVRLALEMAV